MHILNKLYNNKIENYNTVYINENKGTFILLDDYTKIKKSNLNNVKDLISKYDYNVEYIKLNCLGKNILKYLYAKKIEINFDTICLVGTGGSRMFDSMKKDNIFKDKEIIYLKWSRIWENDKSVEFDTNIEKYNFKGKKIMLIEDVIASGETLYNIYLKILELGGEVSCIITALIQECSPLIKKSFAPIYAGVKIKSNSKEDQDVYWYPPIYSLRHILYGDEEMENFYEVISDRYFNKEKDLEKLIKSFRG